MKQYFLPLVLSSFLLSACGPSAQTQVQPDQSVSPTTAQTSAKKSLRDLLSLGIAQKCTYTNKLDNEVITGEIIFSGQKFRQNYVTKIDGKETKGSVLSDGTNIYMWSDDNKTSGITMKIDTTSQDPNNKSFDMDQSYDYNCVPTTVSASDLNPPKDVTFSDLSALQDQMKKFAPTE